MHILAFLSNSLAQSFLRLLACSSLKMFFVTFFLLLGFNVMLGQDCGGVYEAQLSRCSQIASGLQCLPRSNIKFVFIDKNVIINRKMCAFGIDDVLVFEDKRSCDNNCVGIDGASYDNVKVVYVKSEEGGYNTSIYMHKKCNICPDKMSVSITTKSAGPSMPVTSGEYQETVAGLKNYIFRIHFK